MDCAIPTVSPSNPVSGELYIGDVGWNQPRGGQYRQGQELRLALLRRAVPRRNTRHRFAACRQIVPRRHDVRGPHVREPDGHSAIGGAFVAQTYPDKYKGDYFFADYEQYDSADEIRGGRETIAVSAFLSKAEGPCSIEMADGHLYYLSLQVGPGAAHRAFFWAPVAKASATPRSGASPL